MNRNDIIARLQENDSTVLSFPDRGPWGDNRYRGNCSGWYQAFLIWKYKVHKMAELFSGSGTGYDVAKDMGIDYVGADLNPNPVRPGILSVNAVTDEVPVEFTDADFCFMHPPYGMEIGIPYAGSMYPDPMKQLSKSDLGQMPWETFMKTLNEIVMKYFAAMQSGAKMGILMGDVRRKGILHSMLTDIVKPGELEQIIIKMQHNTFSQNRSYTTMDNKELNAAVNQLVELMDESFGLPGYKDYIKENFFMAVEVLKNSGNIYDLDAMVALSKALGMDVSYGFYSFVDKCCDDMTVSEFCSDEDCVKLLPKLLILYGRSEMLECSEEGKKLLRLSK